MQWQLFSQEEYAKLEKDYCLPAAKTPALIAFVVGGHNIKKQEKTFALTQAPPTQDVFPSAYLSWQDLQDSQCWQKIWQVYPLATIDIACYWENMQKKKNNLIDAQVIMESCGWSIHFQNMARWQELGALSGASRKLARKYDFNLRILRLWERFEAEEQQYWLNLWNTHPFGKNIIQDIICLYYEMNTAKRKQARDEVQNISTSWQEKHRYGGTFPFSQVRDVVYALHSPRIYQIKKEVYKQKKKFEQVFHKKTQSTQVKIDIPPDLENARI